MALPPIPRAGLGRTAPDIDLLDRPVVAHDLEHEEFLREGLGALHAQGHRIGRARVEDDDVGIGPLISVPIRSDSPRMAALPRVAQSKAWSG